MNKKNGIIAGIIVILLALGAFFYTQKDSPIIQNIKNKIQETVGIKTNQLNEKSYNYKYTFSGMIKDHSKVILSGDIDAGLYFADKGLKERVILNNLNIKGIEIRKSGKKDGGIINWSGLDIIQNEYNKYVKLGNLSIYDNHNKETKPFEEDKKLKTNSYYKFDDSLIGEKIGQLYENELVKIAVRSYMTSNPLYYLEKNDFFTKFRNALLSQDLAEYIFVKNGEKYEINKNICSLVNLSEYKKKDCLYTIKDLNKYLTITWDKGNSIFITSKFIKDLKISINYKNRIFSNINIKYQNMVDINIDLEGIQKFNIDNSMLGTFVIKYERGKGDLFANIDIKSPSGEIIKGNYKDGKGNFTYKKGDESLLANIEGEKIGFMYKNKKTNSIIKGIIDKNNISILNYVDGKNIFKFIYKEDEKLFISIDKLLKIVCNFKNNKGGILINTNILKGKVNCSIENKTLNIVGNLSFKNKKWVYGQGYKIIEHKISINTKIGTDAVDGNIKFDENTLTVKGKYGKEYNLVISGKNKDGVGGNINIVGKEGNGKITVDMGVKDRPLLTINYDITNDLRKIHIDFDFSFMTSIKGLFEKKLIDGNDTIKSYVEISGEKMFEFNAKGKITKSGPKFEIPQKFEKAPKKLGILGIYSLPNFDLAEIERQNKLYTNYIIESIGNKKNFTKVVLLGMAGIGITSAVLTVKLNGAQTKAQDTARQINLQEIRVALFQYNSNEGIYPEGKNTNDLKDTLAEYIRYMPTDPKTKEAYFYRPLTNMGAEKSGFILGAKMESGGKKCNLNISSEQELEKLLEKNNYEKENIKKLITHKGISKTPCYFIIIN